MRVNAIDNYKYSKVSFKHTAVPYPEFEKAYEKTSVDSNSIFNRISTLFNPSVKKEADVIKNQINMVCDNDKTPKQHLLTVFA